MDMNSDYKLLASSTEVLLYVVVERPSWLAGPARLPAGWLRMVVRSALRKYFTPQAACVFTV